MIAARHPLGAFCPQASATRGNTLDADEAAHRGRSFEPVLSDSLQQMVALLRSFHRPHTCNVIAVNRIIRSRYKKGFMHVRVSARSWCQRVNTFYHSNTLQDPDVKVFVLCLSIGLAYSLRPPRMCLCINPADAAEFSPCAEGLDY